MICVAGSSLVVSRRLRAAERQLSHLSPTICPRTNNAPSNLMEQAGFQAVKWIAFENRQYLGLAGDGS